MLQAVLIILFGVVLLQFILIWDLMNRTRRLGELNNRAEHLLRRITHHLTLNQ